MLYYNIKTKMTTHTDLPVNELLWSFSSERIQSLISSKDTSKYKLHYELKSIGSCNNEESIKGQNLEEILGETEFRGDIMGDFRRDCTEFI